MARLYILSNARCYGGAEKSLEVILPELVKKFSVYMFIENELHYSAVCEKKLKNIELFKLKKGKNVIATFMNVLAIINKLQREKETPLFLTNTRNGAIYLAIISLFYPINYNNTIVYIRDFLWKYKRCLFYLINKANFAVPSKAIIEKKGYIDKYLNIEKVHVTLNAIECRHEYRLCNDSKYILNLANISKWKGQIFLVKAFEESRLFQRGFILRICGAIQDEDCYKNLYAYIYKHGLENSIEICSFNNNPDELYENAAFVVVPSISEYGGPETFGRTIIEAWSHNKSVIAFDVGGPKYIIKNDRDGILVPEKNISLLSEAMYKLATDLDYRNRLALNGYNRVNSEFKPSDVVRRLYRIWNVL